MQPLPRKQKIYYDSFRFLQLFTVYFFWEGTNLSVLIFMYICTASIFGYCIWFVIVKYNSLSKLFIIKFAEPVFASVLGALLLDENIFSIQYLLAFLLIGAGIYISNT